MTADTSYTENPTVPLLGGRTAGLARVGSTVRRPLHARSSFVHAVLRHLEEVGFHGAPRFRGLDGEGREILTFIDGDVLKRSPLDFTDAHLCSVARLVRSFHNATAGTSLAAAEEVVCHGDLGAHNTVFDGDRAVGLIDWEIDVRGGPRLVDLADACWSFADVGGERLPLAEQARRVALMCDAYGWSDSEAVVNRIDDRVAEMLNTGAAPRTDVAVLERYQRALRRDAASLRRNLDVTPPHV
jgi:Ser/Thr protein kinase RdoA (MazF antagonist)